MQGNSSVQPLQTNMRAALSPVSVFMIWLVIGLLSGGIGLASVVTVYIQGHGKFETC